MSHIFSIFFFAALVAVTAPAAAENFPLQVELGSGRIADFGIINVTEDSGGLLFDVQINPAVSGNNADLHRLYFNLHEPTTNLAVETLDIAKQAYSLRRGRPTLGGAGAFFDWSVDFGSGAGAKKGNGVLQHVRFRITGGDQPLVMDGIMPTSTSRANVSVQLAVHLQNASVGGESIATVGGSFEPEPVNQDPPPSSEDQLPPPDNGCTWVIDLFTGEPLYQMCG